MSVGEGASSEFLPEVLEIPDEPVRAIMRIERKLRQKAFARLRTQIDRVELLGRDDASRQSFHRYYTGENGSMRSVFFNAAMYGGFGRVIRVVVNDEFSNPQGTKMLLTEDYMVAAYDNLIASYAGSMAMNNRHTYGGADNYDGPVLYQRSTGLQITTHPNYGLALPQSGGDDPIEVLDRLETVGRLQLRLSALNEVSLQDGVYLG